MNQNPSPENNVSKSSAQPSILRRYGSQLGIIGVGLAMWLAFVAAAPDVFTDYRIYAAFAQTTPQFGLIALALTSRTLSRSEGSFFSKNSLTKNVSV